MGGVRNLARVLASLGLMPKRRQRRSRTSCDPQVERLLIEHLESRRLLAANQISYDAFTRSVVIEGTAGNDSAWVWTDANFVHVQLQNQSGTKSASFSKSTVDWARFFGGAGDDRLENASGLHSQVWGGVGNDLLIG